MRLKWIKGVGFHSPSTLDMRTLQKTQPTYGLTLNSSSTDYIGVGRNEQSIFPIGKYTDPTFLKGVVMTSPLGKDSGGSAGLR